MLPTFLWHINVSVLFHIHCLMILVTVCEVARLIAEEAKVRCMERLNDSHCHTASKHQGYHGSSDLSWEQVQPSLYHPGPPLKHSKRSVWPGCSISLTPCFTFLICFLPKLPAPISHSYDTCGISGLCM